MRRKNSLSAGRKGKIEWLEAADIKDRINYLVNLLNLDWIKVKDIHSFRSLNAATRAYARVWGFSKVWQQALNLPPSYIIEVISEKFDKLPQREKDKVLLHEIAHIPKNFSGSLTPHKRGKGNFHDKLKEMIRNYELLR